MGERHNGIVEVTGSTPVRSTKFKDNHNADCPFSFSKNSTMIPQKISQDSKDNLIITWQDGHESKISLRTLRDGCPCASCQGETILLKHYEPPHQPDQPGKYVIRNAEQIGSYALQISWGDGHSTGLYTWTHLISLCECNECKG